MSLFFFLFYILLLLFLGKNKRFLWIYKYFAIHNLLTNLIIDRTKEIMFDAYYISTTIYIVSIFTIMEI